MEIETPQATGARKLAHKRRAVAVFVVNLKVDEG